MKYLTKEALYVALPIAIVAIAVDFYSAPSVYSSSDYNSSLILPDTNFAGPSSIPEEEADLLLEQFAATNPHKQARAVEAELLAKSDEEHSEPALRDGEQQLANLALRLSGVFEKKSVLYAFVRVRDLESGEETREIVTQGTSLGGLTVSRVDLERLLLVDSAGEQLELVLFKQSAG
ncbi:hypothetical protein [Aliagarivorans marinus]|uniref:hypothetical protein n=1 Tax=Aliagarivorans marinus TaxID=561965 RepID=UPI000421D744|nr:hypothetical protein [Aliagarivorans marinus]